MNTSNSNFAGIFQIFSCSFMLQFCIHFMSPFHVFFLIHSAFCTYFVRYLYVSLCFAGFAYFSFYAYFAYSFTNISNIILVFLIVLIVIFVIFHFFSLNNRTCLKTKLTSRVTNVLCEVSLHSNSTYETLLKN